MLFFKLKSLDIILIQMICVFSISIDVGYTTNESAHILLLILDHCDGWSGDVVVYRESVNAA